MRTTLALPLLAACALGCWVALEDPQGKACDATHACRAGELCVTGRCAVVTVDGWSQGLHGFDSSTTAPGSTVTVDTTWENRLTAAFTPEAAVPRAFGVATQRLPRAGSGRAKGKLLLPAGAPFRGSLSFLQLVTDSGAVLMELSLTRDASGAGLHVDVAPQVLQQDPVINGLPQSIFPAVAQLIAPGVENEVGVSWEARREILVFVNGEEVFQRSLDPGSSVPDAAAYARELRLGHVGFQGSTDAGVTATLYGWTFERYTPSP